MLRLRCQNLHVACESPESSDDFAAARCGVFLQYVTQFVLAENGMMIFLMTCIVQDVLR